METKHKILVLDDDADWLETCRDFLAQLPSEPEIRIASTGVRALSMLDAQPFRVFICDLNMPRMDGLQVLSIVRRRFPNLRTVVLTGLQDDQFRSRAYALGVDLFWLKPDMQQNSQMFLDCIESLLGREDSGGFRDTQAKNLLDVIQMESISENSSVLRITSGQLVAKMWFHHGELVDAAAEGADGEAAFRRILKWKSGTFESLPAEPEHVRTITKSVDAMLLESSQIIEKAVNPTSAEELAQQKFVGQLAEIAVEGAEFLVSVPAKKEITAKAWGTKNTEQLAAWTRHVEKAAQRLGETLSAGPLTHISAHNLERHLLLLPQSDKTYVVGWPPEAMPGHLFEQSKKLTKSWDS
ncbi:MAG TPA: response regulator [Dongiaceae bacterium]|jgi:CheY-like chemotaxis protein|nr:response regulator [Dongiaceae bacterium]